VIAGNNGVVIRKFKQYLQKCFHIKYLGHCRNRGHGDDE